MKRENLIVLAAAMMGLCACSTDTANISGEFSACPEKSIYIEHIAADGAIAADSVVTNANGRFNIKVELPAGEPTLYTLRCEERQIPLIISAGEKVVINSVPGLIDGYTVSGSAESALVKEIRNIMTFGSAKLDSMITVYNETTSKAIQERINSDYAKEYFAIKRNQIEFIVDPRYTKLDVTNLQGVDAAEFSQKVSCTSKVGMTNVQYTFNTICPSLTEETTADVTINIYNSGGSVIYSVTIDDVRFAANTKTLLSGNLFTAPVASVGVNHSWNANIVGSW